LLATFVTAKISTLELYILQDAVIDFSRVFGFSSQARGPWLWMSMADREI
jgi:hypothetical protein